MSNGGTPRDADESWSPRDVTLAPVESLPEPWGEFCRQEETLLTHVGFGRGCSFCQIVSQAGVSVYSVPTLILVHNEPFEGLGIRFPKLEMDGVGPLAGQCLPFSGRFGGGFSYVSSDGWSCDPLPIGPTRHAVLLKPPDSVFDLSVDILANPYKKIFEGGPVIASGFCPCSDHLVIATSRSLSIAARQPDV